MSTSANISGQTLNSSTPKSRKNRDALTQAQYNLSHAMDDVVAAFGEIEPIPANKERLERAKSYIEREPIIALMNDLLQKVEENIRICRIMDPNDTEKHKLLEKVREVDLYVAHQLKGFFDGEFKDVPNIQNKMCNALDKFATKHQNFDKNVIAKLKQRISS